MVEREEWFKIAEKFRLEGTPTTAEVTGSGHIHETILVGTESRRYILQKINGRIFPDAEALMDNFSRVTAHLRDKVQSRGGDSSRECLSLVPTREGKAFWRSGNSAWRMFPYVEDSVCHLLPDRPGLLREAGMAFGEFLRDLADFPASSLHEILPGFHDTHARFQAFWKSVRDDRRGRAASVADDIAFAQAREPLSRMFGEALLQGRLPLRVTHNDAKLDNVLFDAKTGKRLAVIDLDTVMPGTPCHDFGDSVRSGCNPAQEDEPDLFRVVFRMDRFAELAEGYLRSLRGILRETETAMLVPGAMAITFEQGIRFLKDHLDGDVYYRTTREGQNRDRARTQFRLLAEMEERRDEMDRIVREMVVNR